ncbi:zinc finger protein 616 [Bombyx mori]|uniref:Uncharacterized protein n=1 Tax=Bombyx mori TaxID=7091 RepID=A0A8R2R9B3_BOMMO|nr:zinc finger protein 616 [Bombyx mori]
MLDLKACFVCFSVETKLINLDREKVRKDFNLISGLQTKPGEGLPEYLCVYCLAFVKRSIKFREKCKRAHFALQEILQNCKEIKTYHLTSFDGKRLGIGPQLSYVDLDKTHYEQTKFQWVKHNRIITTTGDIIPVAHCSTLANQDIFFEIEVKNNELSEKVKTEVVEEQFVKSFTKNETYEDTNLDAGADDDYYDTEVQNDSDGQETLFPVMSCDINKDENDKADEEYANVYPISVKEAKAALEVHRLYSSNGKHMCSICSKRHNSAERHKIHLRMHDKHISGKYHCKICNYYYKTEFLLQSHMTEKHMYKYVCTKCKEVNFDRASAKQHFIWTHMQKGHKKDDTWYKNRPTWLSSRGGKRIKGSKHSKTPVTTSRKFSKLPEDFLVYSPISHLEQYQLVQDRKKTNNYLDSLFKCELCYRGFRESTTYEKHMKKHDPTVSGNVQCDMCKLYFLNQRKLYKHMSCTHLFKYSCRLCSFVCVNRGQAHAHYRWHKNVTYPCPHCDKVFKKISTQLTHIRLKHPSNNICNLCGHSFVGENGLYCHKQIAHSVEERELSQSVSVNPSDSMYCAACGIQFLNEEAFNTHLGSSNKHATVNESILMKRKPGAARGGGRGRPARTHALASHIVNNGLTTSTNCEVCGKFLSNDVQARKHYETEHPGTEYLKRYMCDVCGHTTRQYANLMVHMRTHTNEKPYECPQCDRRFSMPSNRDRHIAVHTGEKRYQCHHCNRRFTQSNAVKLHIQTVHLKIPYAPWDKKNRKRRKDVEPAPAPPALPCPPPQHKVLLEAQGDYLNAYITYNDV